MIKQIETNNKETVSTREGSSTDSPTIILEEVSNPENGRWVTIDKLLVGWLYNSMTPKIATQVMGC